MMDLKNNWKPKVLNLGVEDDFSFFVKLKEKKSHWRICDTINVQLEDLICSRNPQWVKEGIDHCVLKEEIGSLTKENVSGYGVWVYFPWSGSLVHTLPENEFNELRLNRNQNKITKLEQNRLTNSTVGVIGLSVGNAAAISLALEGVSGTLKLADFDQLDLSNMNRIRASVADIGIPKTILCARQIYEFNPFANIEIFEEGISEKNINEFLLGQQPLDVVIDECDDIRLKFLIRERARSHRIPVIMETSDRGMLDVERFDLEPERPVFHGIPKGVAFSEIPENLTTEEKVPYVAPIVGIETLSDRLAASMFEIGERVSTWPQLASDVLLGGASVCIAVRRILLDEQLLSGRYFIDVDSHLREKPDLTLQNTEKSEDIPFVVPNCLEMQEKPEQLADFMRFLVAHAILAPSGGNSQPWKFLIENDCISVFHDRERSKNIIDPDSCGAYIGLGAAIENIQIAAEANDYSVHIQYLPKSVGHLQEFVDTIGEVVATIRVIKKRASGYSQARRLYPGIFNRVTDRKTYGHIPLRPKQRSQLQDTAAELNFSLTLLESEDELDKISKIIGESDRLRFLCNKTHQELMSEIRWTSREAAKTGDGIDINSFHLTPTQLTGLNLVRRPEVAKLLRQQSGGAGLTELSEKAVKNSSAVGLISIPDNDPVSFLRAGRAIQLFWMKCAHLGLLLHPNTGLIYMFNSRIYKSTLVNHELDTLNSLRERFFQVFDYHEGLRSLLLFRLSAGESLLPKALRKPLPEVLLPRESK